MKCRDYEALVQDFLNGKLKEDVEEDFIHHVSDCPRCFEELEIYFSIYRGIGFTPEEQPEDQDYEFQATAEELGLLLQRRLEAIEHRRLVRRVKVIGSFVFLAILVAVLVILWMEPGIRFGF